MLSKFRVLRYFSLNVADDHKLRKEKERISKIPRYKEGSFNFNGQNIKFSDSASFLFMFNEIFERQIYKFKSISDQTFIIDCGANIGLSILYFKQLYPEASILGFEPDPNSFKLLKNNLEQFGYSDVEVLEKGLWNSDTTLSFYSEGADGGRIALSTDLDSINQISTVRLKKYLAYKKIDFLKIDIEGAEVEDIMDCKEELKNVKKIFIEFHSFIGQVQNLDIILKILKDVGFRIHINNPGLTSSQPFVKLNSYAKMDMQLNIYGFK
jgi:FkbM family methyltransferase